MFHWFSEKPDFAAFAERMRPYQSAASEFLSAMEVTDGYCLPCAKRTCFRVNSGVELGGGPNLREGMICECGLSNRNRLVLHAVLELLPPERQPKLAIFEALSPLYARLRSHYPEIQGSEYVGPTCMAGQEYDVLGHKVAHESITTLSFADDSLDGVVHNDVLEHLFDYRGGLAECHRVLRVGGSLIFTCPFYWTRDEELQRARVLADGTIEHLLPPEYHGDPMNPEGVLVYYHHGWGLVEDLRRAGFRRAEVGVNFDVYAGFVASNHPDYQFDMLPLVLRANK